MLKTALLAATVTLALSPAALAAPAGAPLTRAGPVRQASSICSAAAASARKLPNPRVATAQAQARSLATVRSVLRKQIQGMRLCGGRRPLRSSSGRRSGCSSRRTPRSPGPGRRC